MGRGWGSLLLVCALAEGAAADTAEFHEGCEHLYERMWPGTPSSTRLSMSQQITDELTELGNTLGHHVNALSNDALSLGFDGRKRRAKFRIGLADDPDRMVTFKLVGDVHFTQGRARTTLKLDIGFGERVLHVELRDLEVTHTEYRGDRGVALVIPFIRRQF
jgi:hypothetical protein